MEKTELKSLEEVAIEVLREAKEELTYLELYNRVTEIQNFSEEEKMDNIAQFYTDITASGNFVYCGDDKWNLKENLTLDKLDSEFYSEHAEIELEEDEKPKKKKASKKSKKIIRSEDGEAFVDLTYSELAQEMDKDDEDDNENEDYENYSDESYDDYDDSYSDDDDSYEEDSDEYQDDYDDDLDDDEDDDDYDEDSYNAIMDQWEDSYDK